jgi:sulfopyruvate decarboxylase alpha subunit
MESEYRIGEKSDRSLRERHFFEVLKQSGINFATGVPCGVQKYLIRFLSSDPTILHVPATRESEAIGIAAGAYLAGRCPIVYMQNSGLLDSINTITSLSLAYQIPLLFSVTLRGAPGEDAPQHLINGGITEEVLRSIGLPYQTLGKENIEQVVKSAFFHIKERGVSSVILLIRGAL